MFIQTLKHIFHPQRSNNHRPKFLHPKPLFFLSLIAIGFYQLVGLVSTVHPVRGSILGYASNITVGQVVEQTNAQRAGAGLSTLTYNTQLAQAAIAKAQNMFANNYWAHTSPTGLEPWDFIKSAGYTYKIAGENLARDFDSTSPMVDAWMNSPTHRANIMNPRYQETGVAVIDGSLGGIETTLVVQMFGAPSQTSVVQEPSVAVPARATETVPPAAQQITQSESEVDQEQEEAQQVEITLEEVDAALESIESESEVVLAQTVVPEGQLNRGILYSPTHVLKAFFLSILIVLVSVLIYDAVVAGHKDSVRFVGKNIAHILLFLAVAYLVIAFKGGVVGP